MVMRIRQTGVEKNWHHFWTSIMSRGGTTSKTQFAVTIDPSDTGITGVTITAITGVTSGVTPNTTWHHYVVTSGDITFAGN